MSKTKIAITLEEDIVKRIDQLVGEDFFSNRSRVIEAAVEEKLQRLDQSRLARECAKLDHNMNVLWRRKALMRF